jgi:hypothetical protein
MVMTYNCEPALAAITWPMRRTRSAAPGVITFAEPGKKGSRDEDAAAMQTPAPNVHDADLVIRTSSSPCPCAHKASILRREQGVHRDSRHRYDKSNIEG